MSRCFCAGQICVFLVACLLALNQVSAGVVYNDQSLRFSYAVAQTSPGTTSFEASLDTAIGQISSSSLSYMPYVDPITGQQTTSTRKGTIVVQWEGIVECPTTLVPIHGQSVTISRSPMYISEGISSSVFSELDSSGVPKIWSGGDAFMNGTFGQDGIASASYEDYQISGIWHWKASVRVPILLSGVLDGGIVPVFSNVTSVPEPSSFVGLVSVVLFITGLRRVRSDAVS